ncbi:DUF4328 domain-containing protein [Amycolatopsis vancoresmycina]|uniref:DUF4328 domain-containing protein n=1 Tax=Amycolatopsis vancoresmycina DSM 44592 TaxID=1292037 RepID=R1G9Y3_9PSEU|nr:DUF4328 domain-containing protein [Amycolatopsis vancoresmycina]EOD68178.1 hypothetical protein H480_12627 [Amycolatopsis vancoresmycina DSM 44592]
MHPGQPPQGRPYPPGYWPRPAPPPTAQQLQGRTLAAQPEPYPYHRRPVHRPKLRWVATPPPGAWPRRRVVVPEPYLGPPSYPVPPRWGFPHLVWRRPTTVPGTASDEIRPIDRVPVLSRSLVVVLFAFAVLCAVAAGAEIWRYVLLAEGRESALSRSVVAFSDGFVLAAGLLASILALLPAALSLWWLLVARRAAADVSGDDPPRPLWQVLVGVLVPVANLPMALSVVGELEHAVLGRSRDARPKPSRRVLVWWGTWLLNWILLGVSIAWRFRDDVQSMADSVVLVALTDLSAVALAVMTALVVRRFSALLAPSDALDVREMRVLKVQGAPEPELRTARPAGAAR